MIIVLDGPLENEAHIVKYILSFRLTDEISVGDEVLVGRNNKLTPVMVTNVSTLVMEGSYNQCILVICSIIVDLEHHYSQFKIITISIYFYLLLGAFVPLTLNGNIIVDEILASCYVYLHHDVARLVMAPFRWFPDIIEWLFGEDNGFQVFVAISEELGKWILPS